eukprot:TRINITY_DN22845_c0_g1_i1.p1 TRINITY_DN22845_c0_g1~~TRINITY_DN22845_c0_g1_i1.p1  ORF type:complete len:671 (+),score=120.10 TRINITY_DN22845_c0_g1_i1:346-2358(+)
MEGPADDCVPQTSMLDRIEGESLDVAVQSATRLLKVLRHSAKRPRSFQLVLFSVLVAVLARARRSLEDLGLLASSAVSGQAATETLARLTGPVETLLAALDKSLLCFAPAQAKSLRELSAGSRQQLEAVSTTLPPPIDLPFPANLFGSALPSLHGSSQQALDLRACPLGRTGGEADLLSGAPLAEGIEANGSWEGVGAAMGEGSGQVVRTDDHELSGEQDMDVISTDALMACFPLVPASSSGAQGPQSNEWGLTEGGEGAEGQLCQGLSGVGGPSELEVDDGNKSAPLLAKPLSIPSAGDLLSGESGPGGEVNGRLESIELLARERTSGLVSVALREKVVDWEPAAWALRHAAALDGRGQASFDGRIAVALLSPLTGRRLQVPARGKACAHGAAFELSTFLKSHEKGRPAAPMMGLREGQDTRWRCPLCSADCSWGHLEVDGLVMSILQSAPADVDSVVLSPDGTWKALPRYRASEDSAVCSANLAAGSVHGAHALPVGPDASELPLGRTGSLEDWGRGEFEKGSPGPAVLAKGSILDDTVKSVVGGDTEERHQQQQSFKFCVLKQSGERGDLEGMELEGAISGEKQEREPGGKDLKGGRLFDLRTGKRKSWDEAEGEARGEAHRHAQESCRVGQAVQEPPPPPHKNTRCTHQRSSILRGNSNGLLPPKT